MKDIVAGSGKCSTSQQEHQQIHDPAYKPPSVSDTTRDAPIQNMDTHTSSLSTSFPQTSQQTDMASYPASTL